MKRIMVRKVVVTVLLLDKLAHQHLMAWSSVAMTMRRTAQELCSCFCAEQRKRYASMLTFIKDKVMLLL
jgi:hypothetical protein